MRIELDKHKSLIDREMRKHVTASWLESKPFVENNRAVLIHRPRRVTSYKLEGYDPHLGIEYHCGNTQSGSKKFTFLDEPPKNGIVCHRCEEKAAERGLQGSSEIAGRHVHIGRVKAVTLCCPENLAQ